MGGRGSKTTDKVIKDISQEANLGKHQQNVLGKISTTLCKCRKSTVDKGFYGHQLTLGKSRIRAKGSTVQTEGEKGLLDIEQRREERGRTKQLSPLH